MSTQAIFASTRGNLTAGIDTIEFNGWQNNLRLTNGEVELIITLEVGPRILSYRRLGGFNPLNVFGDQAGQTGETEWRNRGGHRLWIAPEHKVRSYHPDNGAVDWERMGELQVRLTPPTEISNGLQKQLDITLDPAGSGVTIVHRITRLGAAPCRLAAWALSVMSAGGVAVIPQPEMGQHPRDLLPNRSLVLWPYTDMSDPRWEFGRKYIRLRQDPAGTPTKIGLAHAPGWCGYLVGGVCFIKRYAWDASAMYPDNGCNFEIFSNARMLELESLSPLTQLQPNQSVEHIEQWELHDAPASLGVASEEQLHKWLEPVGNSSQF
jgi:hypothetical protein